jgi:hypothetical protein
MVVGKWPQLANSRILVDICLIKDEVTRGVCSPGQQFVENPCSTLYQSIEALTIVILPQQSWNLQ